MSRSELTKTLGSIAGILVSYAASFWLLASRRHELNVLSLIGWVSAIYCALGVGVFFWVKILASVAKKRHWTRRECVFAALVIMIPGCVLFLAGTSFVSTANLLTNQAICTGLLLSTHLYPNFDKNGPFEQDPPLTLFPK